MTHQMKREEALERLENSEMSEKFMKLEFEYIATKLGLSVNELQAIFEGENKTFRDYQNKYTLIGLGGKVMNFLGLERRQYR